MRLKERNNRSWITRLKEINSQSCLKIKKASGWSLHCASRSLFPLSYFETRTRIIPLNLGLRDENIDIKTIDTRTFGGWVFYLSLDIFSKENSRSGLPNDIKRCKLKLALNPDFKKRRQGATRGIKEPLIYCRSLSLPLSASGCFNLPPSLSSNQDLQPL